jgi:hypothetical protein
MTKEHIVEGVQSLPRELYITMYNLIFTADQRERRINSTYRPPKLLSIDRKSRALFAKSYNSG